MKNVDEFKKQLLLDAEESPKGDGKACRVVYSFDRLDSSGSNTQYMRLTAEDLAALGERDEPKK